MVASLVLVALVVTLFACAKPAPKPTPTPTPTPTLTPTPAKPIVWEFSSMLPNTHFSQVPFEEFAKRVEEATGGLLRVKLNWSGTLLPGPETLAAVMEGTIQSGFIGTNWHPDLIPDFQVLEFPMALLPDKPLKTTDDIRGFWSDFLDVYSAKDVQTHLRQHLESKGVKALWITSMPPIFVYSQKPIATLDDWKGVKVRTTGPIASEFISAVGGTPVVVSTGEVYTSWERGLVDAGITAYSSMASLKWFEVANVANHWTIQGGAPMCFIASGSAWNALPANIRTTVEQVLSELEPSKMSFELGLPSEEKAVNDLLTQYKGQIVSVSVDNLKAGREKAIPVYKKIIKDLGPGGGDWVKLVWGKEWGDEFLARVLE